MEQEEKHYGNGSRKPWGAARRDDRPRRNWDSNERPYNRERRNYSNDTAGTPGERPRYHKPYRSNQGDYRPRRFDSDERRGAYTPRREYTPADNGEGQTYGNGDYRRPRTQHDGYRPRRDNGYGYGDRRQARPARPGNGYRKPYDPERQPRRPFDGDEGERQFRPRRFNGNGPRPHKPQFQKNRRYDRPINYTTIDKNLLTRDDDNDEWADSMILDAPAPVNVNDEELFTVKRPATEEEGYRLNRFISNAGICSRRAADDLIASGKITVNGQVVTDFATKVFPGDDVRLDGNKLESQTKVYIVFNKPKDCVSTKSDPNGRRTVYDYISGCSVKVESVGRLDRNTTGVMLFTNDGNLMERLLHPRYNKMKIYHVFLNKNLSGEDYETILGGMDLDFENEDGTVERAHVDVDDLQYVEGAKNQLGIQIHSGKNRVVRRIFESLGYKVEKLDRVYFAGLTKKNLPRGRWRFLTAAEVATLKRGAYA